LQEGRNVTSGSGQAKKACVKLTTPLFALEQCICHAKRRIG